MKRHVYTNKASHTQNITIKNLDKVDVYAHMELTLYYAENNYEDYNYGHSVKLYYFKVVRETKCYYILGTGQRISKKLTGRTFSTTPYGAVTQALARAHRYLDILISRGEQVSNFLKATSFLRKPGMRALREFEAIAMQFKDPDTIPPQFLQEIDPDLLKKDPFL